MSQPSTFCITELCVCGVKIMADGDEGGTGRKVWASPKNSSLGNVTFICNNLQRIQVLVKWKKCFNFNQSSDVIWAVFENTRTCGLNLIRVDCFHVFIPVPVSSGTLSTCRGDLKQSDESSLDEDVSFHATTCARWACRGYRRVRPMCSRDLVPGSTRRRPDRTAHTGTGPAGTHPPLSPQTTTAEDERADERSTERKKERDKKWESDKWSKAKRERGHSVCLVKTEQQLKQSLWVTHLVHT